MSWESTQHYYQVMNRYVHARLGKHHSLESIVYSVDFERVLLLWNQKNWEGAGKIVAHLAEKLEVAGADVLILASNAIHKIFPLIERVISIPMIHIVDPTGEAIQKQKIKKVGLLGTKVTMEETFYRERLRDRFGLEVLLPEPEERAVLDKIVFDELTLGAIRPQSKLALLAISEKLSKKGAEGIILGCTELTLILKQQDTKIPLFDTTDLHAKAAVDVALNTLN